MPLTEMLTTAGDAFLIIGAKDGTGGSPGLSGSCASAAEEKVVRPATAPSCSSANAPKSAVEERRLRNTRIDNPNDERTSVRKTVSSASVAWGIPQGQPARLRTLTD